MWPGMRPATGWIAYDTSTPRLSSRSASSRTSCCACAAARPYPGTMMTFCAYASWIAASSALTSRMLPPVGPPASPAESPVPKPPTMMAGIDRFIASAISLVRMPPDAPTSAPAMIRTELSMTKPAIATAVPVNALSSEMTTGMSAPPIGSTIVTPNASDATSTAHSRPIAAADDDGGATISQSPPPSITIVSSTLRTRTPGNTIGLRRDRALQLAGGDQRTGERDRADDDVEHGRRSGTARRQSACRRPTPA